MNARPINQNDFEFILELDKKVYPTSNPVTQEIIKKWYIKNPEFGMIYEYNKKVVAVCIIIPLNKIGWEKLISGKLSESELDDSTIFDSKRDKEIGLHFYHIEKLDKNIKEFYKIALPSLFSHLSNLKIIGLSALCVTKEGINLFVKKLNFKERNYKINEHVLEKDGKKIIAIGNEKEIKERYLGYNYLRCQMLVLYSNEKSIVWTYL